MPWLILLPAAGIAAVVLLWPKAEKKNGVTASWGQPAGGATTITSGGARARRYVQRVTAALGAWQAVRLVGGAAAGSALASLKGTFDVVKSMAQADALAGRITDADLLNVEATIDNAKKQIV